MKMQKIQRNAFNNKRTNVQQDEVMIICDFKENIRLGEGPVQLNHEYYGKQQCSVFGCQVVYFNQRLKKIKTVNVDYFSDILNHDGAFVKDCLQKLLEDIYDICPNLNPFKKVNVWSDVGNHFRCQEVAHYLIVDLKRLFNVDVTWDNFVECHGKSTVDSHFGVLTGWMKEFAEHKKIKTAEELISELERKVRKSNRNRRASDRSMYRFFIYDQTIRPAKSKRLVIPKIKCFYHFEAKLNDEEERILRLKVTSDSPYVEDENIHKKIQIIEANEKRIIKLGSKCTEESTHGKGQNLDISLSGYGPNTKRRFRLQAGLL